MPTIVTGNCKGCRFTDCVTVCPVACFHGDDEMLYIDNNVCIDCGACIPVCPVKAIYEEADLPEELRFWIAINAERAPNLQNITDKQAALPGADARKTELGF